MKKKLMFVAPANSIHAHKWIDYFTKEYEIIWISFDKNNFIDVTNSKYKKNFNLIKVFDIDLFTSIYLFPKLILTSLKFKPDLVHIHSANKYLFFSIFFLLFFKKIILTIWGSDYIYNKNKYIYKKFFIFCLKKISLITTDANHIKKSIVNEFNYKSIEIINFGLGEFFYNKPMTDNLVDKKIFNTLNNLRLKKNSFIIYSNRSFTEISDIDIIIKSYIDLRNKFKDVYLLMTGHGPLLDKFKKKYEGKEFFLGIYIFSRVNMQTLKYLYSNTNVFISASRSDAGISTSISEAMFHNVFCLVSNKSDNHLWIKNFYNGILFKTGSRKDLSKKLENFYKNKNIFSKKIKLINKSKLRSNSYITEMDKMNRMYFKL